MRFAAILILILSLSGAVFAQQTQTGAISLSMTDTDLSEALATLSQKANVSILGDTTVKGKVTCSLSNMTTEQALDTICKMNKMEWYKTYAQSGATEKPSATKLFKLVDALKGLGGAAVICTDPTAKTQTVFIPGVEAGAVDTSALATSMKLKEVYLVRAIPDPAAKAKDPQVALKTAPLGDAAAAATQVWDYFQQMPLEQRAETMHQLFTKMRENTTPEQRDAMRQQFGGRGGPGGQGGNRGDNGRNNGQGGDHNRGTANPN